MIKTITNIGESQGIIFDSALLDFARLKPGDQVNVEVHHGGTITLTPMRSTLKPADFGDITEDVMQRYAQTLRRLA